MTSIYLDGARRGRPFLEVSDSTLDYISSRISQNTNEQSSLDQLGAGKPRGGSRGLELDNAMTFWTTLTKVGDVVQNGRRLENLGWRLINRKLILHNSLTAEDYSTVVEASKGVECQELRDSQAHKRKLQKRIPRNSSRTSLNSRSASDPRSNPNSRSTSNPRSNPNSRSTSNPRSNPNSRSSSRSRVNPNMKSGAPSLFGNMNMTKSSNGGQASGTRGGGAPNNKPSTINGNDSRNSVSIATSLTKVRSESSSVTVSPLFSSRQNTQNSKSSLSKQSSKRKTNFFIDQSSPDSQSISPMSPAQPKLKSISNVIGLSNKNPSLKPPNYPNPHNMVNSLFGAKNDSLHSLVNQVQKNKHIEDVHNKAITTPSLFGKPKVPQSNSNLPQNHQHTNPQNPQHHQHHHPTHPHHDRQNQQLLHSKQADRPARMTSPEMKAVQLKSNSSQVSMVSATSTTSLFQNKAGKSTVVVQISSDDDDDESGYDDDDDYDEEDDDEDDEDEDEDDEDYNYTKYKKYGHKMDHDDDDDWSSLSEEDEDDESKIFDSKLQFSKQNVTTDDESSRPTLKRSLLSGLFLDELGKEKVKERENESHKGFKGEIKNNDDRSSNAGKQVNRINMTHGDVQNQGSKGLYDSHHRSNAPPTAATLLPTALSTHIFLPTKNFQTFQSTQRQQYAGQKTHVCGTNTKTSPQSHTSGTQAKSTKQQSQHQQHQHRAYQPQQHQQHVVSQKANTNMGSNDITKLTTANVAKYTSNERLPENVEYASSIRTSTSSIDIPGSESKLLREKRWREREIERKTVNVSHTNLNMDGNITGIAEIGGTVLPIHLVDSIHNENKLFGRGDNRSTNDLQGVTRDNGVFRPDGFVDDSIIVKKYGISQDEDTDLNYHARGW